MALQKGKRVGGGYLDLKALCKDQGPTLVVFRIVKFLPPEPASFKGGINYPVVADAVIASGARQGEVWFEEKFKGAITGPLRGVANPKPGKDASPPETSPGDEILLRIKAVNLGAPNESAVGDEPSDVEMAEVEKFYNGGAVWSAAPANAPSGNGTQLATTGAGGGTRPW